MDYLQAGWNHRLGPAERINDDQILDTPNRNLAFGVKVEAMVTLRRIANGFGYGDGRGFGLTTQPGREIDRAADSGVIQVLRRADIADDRTAGVNSDTKAPDICQIRLVFDPSGVEHIQSAKAALKNHIRPSKIAITPSPLNLSTYPPHSWIM